MPASLIGLTIFAFGIAPGFLFVRAYTTRRVHTPPERDLYAVAQAVVASLIWLGVVWLFLLWLGDPVTQWGLLPYAPERLAQHRSETALVGLVIVTTPYFLGIGAAWLVAWLEDLGITSRIGPTTWDDALRTSGYTAQVLQGVPLDLTIRLKSGVTIFGRLGPRGRGDLSPRAYRDVFLDTGFAVLDPERSDAGWTPPLVILEATDADTGGIFVKGSEIEAIAIEIL